MSKSARMTFDEIMVEIESVAQNGEGADKFRALKILMSQESGSSGLPDPLTDDEILERLSRLIKASGPTAAQLAYRRAFPASKRGINASAPKVTLDDMPGIDKSTLPRNLRELYRMFPEIKKPGVPVGFPSASGIAVKKEWCQKQALRMLMDREQKKLDMISTEAAESAEGVEEQLQP